MSFVRLEISPGAQVFFGGAGVSQFGNFDFVITLGSVDKFALADINADMADLVVMAEKHQISVDQFFLGDRLAHFELFRRGSGDIDSAQVVDRFDKGAAIQTFYNSITTPFVRNSYEPLRCSGSDIAHFYIMFWFFYRFDGCGRGTPVVPAGWLNAAGSAGSDSAGVRGWIFLVMGDAI